MKIFQITMGLLVGAVLFLGSHEPANAQCAIVLGTSGEDHEVDNAPDGFCVRQTNSATFNVTATTVGASEIAAITGRPFVGIYVEDTPSIIDNNTINVSDSTTIDSLGYGIYGEHNNFYNIDGDIVAGFYGISVTDGNVINIGATSHISGSSGLGAFNGNTITIDGDIVAECCGVLVDNDNIITLNGSITATTGMDVLSGNTIDVTEHSTIDAAETGIKIRDDNTLTVDGTINAYDGIWAAGQNNTITVTENGTINLTGVSGTGIYTSGGNLGVTVDGTIYAPGVRTVGVELSDFDIFTLGESGKITANDGVIGSEGNTITIDGEIVAGTHGVVLTYGNTVTVNGTITANVGIEADSDNTIDVYGSIIATTIPGVPEVPEVIEDPDAVPPIAGVPAIPAIPAQNAIGIDGGSFGTVRVHETGSVTSDHIGILVGNIGFVDVWGDVHGDKYGVSTDIGETRGGTFIRVNETGSVSGDIAIRTNGVGNLVSNWGEISGNSEGIHFHGNDYAPDWFSPWVDNPANQIDKYRALSNRGLIEATGEGIEAVTCAEDEADCVPGGTIYGVVFHDSIYPDVTNLLLNAGTIRAVAPVDSGLGAVAIKGGLGEETIHNYTGGTIIGDVETGSGNDTVYLYAGSTFEGNLDMGRTEADPGGYNIRFQTGDGTPDFYLNENGVAVQITEIIDDVAYTVDYIRQRNDSSLDNFGDEIYNEGVDGEIDFDVDPVTGKKVVRIQNNPNWNPEPNGSTHDILVAIVDDPLTTEDESQGGTAYHVVTATDLTYDSGTDGLVLADPVVLNVTNRVPDDIFTNGLKFMGASATAPGEMVEGYYGGDITEVETLLKTGEATWTLGGNVTIDGSVSIGSDGAITTYGTQVESGALLIDGTLTSGKVFVQSGATIGGSGTIVTDPGLAGGEGGLRFGAVPLDSEDVIDGAPSDPIQRAAFLELNNLPENFVSETFLDETMFTRSFQSLDAEPAPAILAPGNSPGTLDVAGNVYLLDKTTDHTTYLVSGPDDRETQNLDGSTNFAVPDGIQDFDYVNGVKVLRTGPADAIIDLVTQYDGEETEYLSPGDDLSPPDNVTDFQIGDDPATLEVETDAVFDVTYNDHETEGREVVTSWGTVYEAELSTDGEHDRLNVTKSGATTAVVATMHPATEAIPAIAATEDAPAVAAVPAVAAYTSYGAVPVPDGVVFLGGRLDIQLDDYITSAAYEEPVSTRYNHYGLEGHIYDIIVAEGGVEGVFQDIGFDGGGNDGTVLLGYKKDGSEARLPVFKGFLEYMPDRVRITSIPIFQVVGETDNQIAVGQYIDRMALYGVHQDPLQGSFAALGQSGDVPMALDLMSPEFFDPYTSVALSLSHGTTDTILDRVYETHAGVAVDLTTVGNSTNTSVGSSGSDNSFVFWAGGNWNSSDVSSDEGYIEYDYDTLVGYVGVDYVLGSTGMIGLVASFGNTELDYDASSASSGDVDHWSISGYGSYFIGDKAHVTAGGGHGSLDIETTREDALDHVTNADYDGEYTFFFAQVASTYALGGHWQLTPSIDMTHTKIEQDEITEMGDSPFALNVDAQSNKSLRGTARARVSHEWEPGVGHILAYATLGVAHEFKDGLHVMNARFVGDDGNFTVHGASFHGTSALIGVGVVMNLNDTWAVEASYNGELSSNYDNHGVSLNVQAAF